MALGRKNCARDATINSPVRSRESLSLTNSRFRDYAGPSAVSTSCLAFTGIFDGFFGRLTGIGPLFECPISLLPPTRNRHPTISTYGGTDETNFSDTLPCSIYTTALN